MRTFGTFLAILILSSAITVGWHFGHPYILPGSGLSPKAQETLDAMNASIEKNTTALTEITQQISLMEENLTDLNARAYNSDMQIVGILEDIPLEAFAQMPPQQLVELRGMIDHLSQFLAPSEANDQIPSGTDNENPVILARGDIESGDELRQASGTVFHLQLGDKQIIRLENLAIANSPGVHVYLTKDGNEDLSQDFIDLGTVKASTGQQNYSIPTGTDTTKFNTVIIKHDPLDVLFARSLLREPTQEETTINTEEANQEEAEATEAEEEAAEEEVNTMEQTETN